jgi:hypothetical protein
MGIYIEEKLLNSVKKLLLGRVNELLGEMEYPIPPIELGDYRGGAVVVPAIGLSGCERSEKERIIREEAYSLTIAFAVREEPSDQGSVRPRSGGERNCYAYASAVAMALGEDPTLSGAADRAVLTGKKYIPPKHPGAGEGWGVELKIHILVDF